MTISPAYQAQAIAWREATPKKRTVIRLPSGSTKETVMQVRQLIAKLEEDPGELFKELAHKQAELKTEVAIAELKLHNISVIMRLANNMAARRRLTDLQMKRLTDCLVSSTGGYDQTLDDLFRIDSDIPGGKDDD